MFWGSRPPQQANIQSHGSISTGALGPPVLAELDVRGGEFAHRCVLHRLEFCRAELPPAPRAQHSEIPTARIGNRDFATAPARFRREWRVSGWDLKPRPRKTPRTRALVRAAPRVLWKVSAESARLAERVGFEPTVGFPTHAFQACALSHSAISPESQSVVGGEPLSACRVGGAKRPGPTARRSLQPSDTASPCRGKRGAFSPAIRLRRIAKNEPSAQQLGTAELRKMAEREGFEPSIGFPIHP